jgi:hypothetical protein
MKKYYNYLLFVLIVLFIGINTVFAEGFNATIHVDGKNKVGETLGIFMQETLCTDPATCEAICTAPKGCMPNGAKWYYNDTNSTEGGTEIPSTVDRNAENSYEYTVEESMVGKYIYVELIVWGTDENNEYIVTDGIQDIDLKVKAITNEKWNTSATVLPAGSDPGPTGDEYVKYTLDPTKYNVTITTSGLGEAESSLKAKVDGLEKADGVYYTAYLAKNKNVTVPLEKDTSGCKISGVDYKYAANGRFVKITANSEYNLGLDSQWYMLKDYDQLYIIKHYVDSNNKNVCEITKSPIQLSRPDLLGIGARYQYSLYTDKSLSTSSLYPYSYDTYGKVGTHILKTKVGVISDTSLLKKLAKKETGAMSELLTYAKSAQGTTFQSEQNNTFKIDIGSFKVNPGSYYFMYTTLDDADGVYRDIDDVAVAMGSSWGSLVNEVVWDPSLIDDDPEPGSDEPVIDIWTYTIVYEDGGGKDGVTQMDNQMGTLGEPVQLAYCEYEWLKPKKRTFLGWKVYIEDAEGHREAVKSVNGNILTVGEGETIDEGVKVPKGGRLILVATWSPATGFVLPFVLIFLLSLGSAAGITYTKKKRVFARI